MLFTRISIILNKKGKFKKLNKTRKEKRERKRKWKEKVKERKERKKERESEREESECEYELWAAAIKRADLWCESLWFTSAPSCMIALIAFVLLAFAA